jgi:hypothetical protein
MVTSRQHDTDSPPRLVALSGVAFVLLSVLAIVVTGGNTPEGDASAAKVTSFYQQHHAREVAAAFVLAAAVPFVVLFGAALATAFSPRQGTRVRVWELVLFGGSILTGAAWLVNALIHFVLADGAHQGLSAEVLRGVNMLDANVWVAFNSALGVMMLGAAGSLTPQIGGYRRMGWIALVLGIALFIPYADFFALVVSGVWIIATSIMLSRTGRERRFASAPQAA